VAVEAVHHILRVTDIERAIRFYRDGLGFEVAERPAEWWGCLFYETRR
jgi:catechol 2,3-dioxygenase-like lactoylglutathione lyase family enzyme